MAGTSFDGRMAVPASIAAHSSLLAGQRARQHGRRAPRRHGLAQLPPSTVRRIAVRTSQRAIEVLRRAWHSRPPCVACVIVVSDSKMTSSCRPGTVHLRKDHSATEKGSSPADEMCLLSRVSSPSRPPRRCSQRRSLSRCSVVRLRSPRKQRVRDAAMLLAA